MLKVARTIAALSVCFIGIGAMTAGPVRAEMLNFSYIAYFGDPSATWTQSSTPVVDSVDTVDGYDIVEVTNGIEYNFYPSPTDDFTQVEFNDSDSGGGFSSYGNIGVQDFGGVIYTSGTLAAPVFSMGTFTLGQGTLTVTEASAVPEPATWALMVLGAGGLGARLRARRRGGVRVAA